jgi:tetratricopeptide (TPR) repeat protein
MTGKIPEKTKRDLKSFKELQSFSVYVRLFSQTEVNGTTRSVFKIIVEDNISHHKYLGYSLEKNKNSIDIFVNYVLSNLQMRGGLNKNYQLVTGRDLTESDRSESNKIGKIKKHEIIKDNLSHKEILGSIYKELIFNEGYAEMEGYAGTKNPILPPLFVDSFISDFDKITKFTDYWHNKKISEKDNKILKNTLIEAENEVDKHRNKLDFEKALKFYKRLNSAAVELADSEKLTARFLLKQVKIYFHLEQYDECRDLIQSQLNIAEKLGLNDELGEFYYYLGMMSSYSNKTDEADGYFAKSSRMLTDTKEPYKTYIYFRSRIRRYILKKDFEHSIVLVNKSIRHAFRQGEDKELSYLYGLKAEIYLRKEKYDLALDNLNIQLEYARKTNDKIAESGCMVQMFLVFSYCGKIEETKAVEYLKRIKKLSKITKKASNYYDAIIGLAAHYYKNNKEIEAEKYFKRASTIYTVKTTDAASHIVNMIYLSKIRINRKNYLSAIRLLNRMLKLCESSNVNIYPAYIENLLGRIYSEKEMYSESNAHLKKALYQIKKSRISDRIIIANTYKYIGINYSRTGIKNLAVRNLNSSLKILNQIKNDKNTDGSDTISYIKSEIDRIIL